jgi:hypothetical protein
VKKEKDLIKKLKSSTPQITWDRVENLAVAGLPDLLGYNKNHTFFTLETKLAKVNSVNFRPHQIAWHCRHPVNAFILLFSQRHRTTKLFKSTSIHDLRKQGHQAPNHVALSFDEINEYLMSL